MSTASANHVLAVLIRHLSALSEVNAETAAHLLSLPVRTAQVTAGTDIVREGDTSAECVIVLDGVLSRYKNAELGNRQLLSMHFAGDMPDLQSVGLEVLDHALVALTDARIALVRRDLLRAAMLLPEVNKALVKLLLVDSAITREWVLNNGQRTALARIASLLCEFYARLAARGLAERYTFDLPITQSDLADATGLSTVHVNRTLQALRRLKLIATRGRAWQILDWAGLVRAAEFRPTYLHLRNGIDEPQP